MIVQLPLRAAIELEAARLLNGASAPVDVEVVAGRVGIVDVTYSDRISGSALLVGTLAGKYAVVLRRKDVRVRHRFSMAHEVGHIVLADRYAMPRFGAHVASRRERSPVEAACDFFAGALLMPRELVNAEVASGASVTVLRTRFDVSEEAMRIRLRDLGHHGVAKGEGNEHGGKVDRGRL